jgi:hypothetical protein
MNPNRRCISNIGFTAPAHPKKTLRSKQLVCVFNTFDCPEFHMAVSVRVVLTVRK